MAIILLIIYYEVFPILFLVKKKLHILYKIALMVVYNYLLIKLFVPPSIYKLQELGWNDTVIEYFYIFCEVLRFTAPILSQILVTLLTYNTPPNDNNNEGL